LVLFVYCTPSSQCYLQEGREGSSLHYTSIASAPSLKHSKNSTCLGKILYVGLVVKFVVYPLGSWGWVSRPECVGEPWKCAWVYICKRILHGKVSAMNSRASRVGIHLPAKSFEQVSHISACFSFLSFAHKY
jgi:hypothetical protein